VDGRFFHEASGFNFGIPIKKLYLIPNYSKNQLKVEDTSGNISRSLYIKSYSIIGKYNLFNTGYVDMLFSNNYVQEKSAFSFYTNIIPTYNNYGLLNPEDSMFNSRNIPFWGDKVSLLSIKQYMLEVGMVAALNLVHKKFFACIIFEQRVAFHHDELQFRTPKPLEESFKVDFPFYIYVGSGMNWDRFFIKAYTKIQQRNYGFRDFYYRDFGFFGIMSIGMRFKAPKKLNDLRNRLLN
jgi:hypothetical protein